MGSRCRPKRWEEHPIIFWVEQKPGDQVEGLKIPIRVLRFKPDSNPGRRKWKPRAGKEPPINANISCDRVLGSLRSMKHTRGILDRWTLLATESPSNQKAGRSAPAEAGCEPHVGFISKTCGILWQSFLSRKDFCALLRQKQCPYRIHLVAFFKNMCNFS